ncbi:hypothetical protein [Halocatena halophila]|uniref:hypothetical protein n=1 Tax=Halocatena halophila TaxID=2814576 RepID=UPI002ED12442
MVERKENTADIVVNVGSEEVTVANMTYTKDIDVSAIYGSGQTIPNGYTIGHISYEGEIECEGNKHDINGHFFDGNGVPQVLDSITVTHLDGSETAFYEVLCTSEGYEVSDGDTTTTTYEYIAMRKGSAGSVDTNPL